LKTFLTSGEYYKLFLFRCVFWTSKKGRTKSERKTTPYFLYTKTKKRLFKGRLDNTIEHTKKAARKKRAAFFVSNSLYSLVFYGLGKSKQEYF
jgi:hypothetical protein